MKLDFIGKAEIVNDVWTKSFELFMNEDCHNSCVLKTEEKNFITGSCTASSSTVTLNAGLMYLYVASQHGRCFIAIKHSNYQKVLKQIGKMQFLGLHLSDPQFKAKLNLYVCEATEKNKIAYAKYVEGLTVDKVKILQSNSMPSAEEVKVTTKCKQLELEF